MRPASANSTSAAREVSRPPRSISPDQFGYSLSKHHKGVGRWEDVEEKAQWKWADNNPDAWEAGRAET
ncbi:MAG: hypothetical protein VB089_02965 [Anaerolineaceae bacterium]|nr:hypothetical protein [Anaerolineaceae bacterium]